MVYSAREVQYGEIFGGTILGVVGHGSNGKTTVYKLVQNQGRQYYSALKVVPIISDYGKKSQLSADYLECYKATRAELCDKAENEVSIMNDLRGCPNIVYYEDFRFRDWEDDEGFGCDLLIKMPLLEGLLEVVKRGTVLPESSIINLGKDICRALTHCHASGIIHRDIKIENVFQNKHGVFLLGDFGISRILSNTEMVTTGTGNNCTVQYAAPEQYFCLSYDHRVDIYSLGLTLYVLANNNRLPFAKTYSISRVSSEVRRRMDGEKLPAPTNCSHALAQVILKACAYDAKDRFSSAQEFYNALVAVEGSSNTINTSEHWHSEPAQIDPLETDRARPEIKDVPSSYHVSKDAFEDENTTDIARPSFSEISNQSEQKQIPVIDQHGQKAESKDDVDNLDYASASQIAQLATQGDPIAQCKLGELYYFGYERIKQDRVTAAKWFRKSAEQGNAIGQWWLSSCYHNGEGVEKNQQASIKWLTLSAEQGYVEAQWSLAMCYYFGEGVVKDEKSDSTMFSWLEKAALQGHIKAQYELAECYLNGVGTDKDIQSAIAWYQKAALQGYGDALFRLGVCFLEGNGVRKDPVEATKLFLRASDKGCVSADYYLGECYSQGYHGITIDLVEAAKRFRKAAEKGAPFAQVRLGDCYFDGKGVEKSKTKAMIWYQAAARQNIPEIMELLKERNINI